ncbi:MAG: hypothetical protein ACAI43_08895 [Phycisphaerae bacterium]
MESQDPQPVAPPPVPPPPIPAAAPPPLSYQAPPYGQQPYAPTLQYMTPPQQVKDLRQIAIYQKGVLFAILAYVVAVFLQFGTPGEARVLVAIVALGAVVTGAVFVFMMAIALDGPGWGTVLGILTLIPLVGLIVLLVVNGRATSLLRQHGVPVGLFGAPLDRVPPRY